jgi:hypothetical protein
MGAAVVKPPTAAAPVSPFINAMPTGIASLRWRSPMHIRKAGNPSVSQVHVATPLTNIAVAYMQDSNNFIADKVFPIVPVLKQSDLYYSWNKDDFFRDEAQLRADGASSAGSDVDLTTASYAAKVWALHKDIGDQMRRNADPAVDVETAISEYLMGKLLIRRDRQFASQYLVTGKWGTDITGTAATSDATHTIQWSDDANSDPFTDIANGQTAMLQNTGQEANRLVLGFPVYQALRKHPLVVDRIKYTMQADAKNITPELLAAAFDVDQVLVSKATYNSANKGATGAYNFAVGKVALLCHTAPAPGLMIPSAGYIFGWAGLEEGNGVGISSWSEPLPNRGRPGSTVRVEAEMAFDMKLVGSDLGYFFTSIVA